MFLNIVCAVYYITRKCTAVDVPTLCNIHYLIAA
jgi:hypothetical protein